MPKLYMLTEHSPFMMGFVFITDCNTAVIIDGGREDDLPHLMELVGDRPIRAWILTHPRKDHITGFIRAIQQPEIADRIEKICYNFPSPEFVLTCEKNFLDSPLDAFYAALPAVFEKCVTAAPGLTLSIDGLSVEFLFCGCEKYRFPKPNLAVNEGSLVCRVTAEQMRSILFLGDLGPCGGRDLLKECGDKLPSDIVQMAHHGHSGVTLEVYRKIAPAACLWCAPEWLWEEPDVEIEPELFGTRHTRKWMDELGVREHYVTKDGTQEIPLKLQ